MKKTVILLVAASGLSLVASGGRAEEPLRVKEFTLTAREIPWRLASGKVVKGWAYNGRIPGPEIRVKEGDLVRITLKNELPVATTIHWHGVDVPWTMDGPPGVNQQPVKPGETFVYEFVAKPAGTRFYHTHGSGGMDEALQMDMGLYGAFIVEAKDEPKYDRDYTLILSERLSTLMPWEGAPSHPLPGYPMPAPPSGQAMPGMEMSDTFFMNGKSWPEAEPLKVKPGERVRVRLINAGSMSTHPMHLRGHTFKIIAIDGNPLPTPIKRDVVPLAPGERYDIELTADNPGVWLFHCHELHHADTGMATLVQYEGFEPVGRLAAPAMPGMKH